jgi:hypothetical protein
MLGELLGEQSGAAPYFKYPVYLFMTVAFK